jgi:transcriptional regulator with XRE-family HTH domain
VAPAASIRPLSEDAAVAMDESWHAQLVALGAFIRAQRLTARLSLRDLADRTAVSNTYLSQVERGLHEPSLRVLRAIAGALGISLPELLARAGVVDPPPGARASLAHDTEAAILHDPDLSEPQRVALLSVYRSFVPARRRL